jgi:hypothetical protein
MAKRSLKGGKVQRNRTISFRISEDEYRMVQDTIAAKQAASPGVTVDQTDVARRGLYLAAEEAGVKTAEG